MAGRRQRRPGPEARRSATWRKNWTCSPPATSGECVEGTGRPPISTKWVDVNKGTVQNQIIRSRLGWLGISASRASPTGPISLRRCHLWRPSACCFAWLFGVVGRSRVKGTRIMLIDVKKAHLNGEVPQGREGLRVAAVGKLGEPWLD